MGTLPRTYTITELAKAFDVTTRAIRFYEDQGLLNPRRDGRTRVYSSRDRVRLMLTLRGKRLGFSLSEIREYFDLYDSAKDEKPQLKKFIDALAKRRRMLEQQQEDIKTVLGEIYMLETQCHNLLKKMEHKEKNKNVSG